MKAVLVLLVVLTTAACWAQGEGGTDDPCTFSVTVADDGCTDVTQCSGGPVGHGCTASSSFSVPCDGCYCVKCVIVCTSGDCSKCLAEAYVVDGSGNAICCHGPCGTGSSCTPQCCYMMLSGGTAFSYTLHACKINCAGVFSCRDCPGTCQAQVTLSYVGASCP